MDGLICSICGGHEFHEGAVLWPELISEWQLTQDEVAYVDRQQGRSCTSCGASLRTIALANAIRTATATPLLLRDAIAQGHFAEYKILDCNDCGRISEELAGQPHYQRADYPEYDLHALSFPDHAFDLIIHSDTLEHVERPVRALEECRRVLKPGGHLCYTVPIIVGRLSRSRAGLPLSYHGDAAAQRPDFVVHTEFGADAWRFAFEAGFADVSLTEVEYPSAIAITASNPAPACPHCPALVEEEPAVPEPSQSGSTAHSAIYDQDGLRSIHNHEFMDDPAFQAAYARGVQAAGTDYHWHWRVHVGLWAAKAAAKLPGDFVEFGVNRGFLSSAIMQLLDWNSTDRTFYLLDTFTGIDERYIDANDISVGVIERNQREIESGFYTFDLDEVRANFSEWRNARLIVGPVPETLSEIDSNAIAFAHIDMNCAPPEVAAAEFVWPRLASGGLILLDDYAYEGYRSQKLAMDQFAASKGTSILSLPTGQGLLLKL